MENLNLDMQTLIIIGGSVLLFLVVLILLLRRRKKNGGTKSPKEKSVKVEGKKYLGTDPRAEELEEAPKLELEKFDDGSKTLSFRFKIEGGRIKMDEIDPYDNAWGRVVNYNELVGQTRSSGELLHVYMERKDRKRASRPENVLISIVYREENGKQWLQQIKYSSEGGAKMGALKTLN